MERGERVDGEGAGGEERRAEEEGGIEGIA